jgi:hypothetical protein
MTIRTGALVLLAASFAAGSGAMISAAGAGVLIAAPRTVDGGNAEKAEVPIDPDTAASEVAIDYDPTTGNFFAVIRWGSSWGLFMSENHGGTWVQTYDYDGFLKPGMVVDLSVHDGHAYVAYSFETIAGTSLAAIRRFDASTGARDDAWGSHTVHSDGVRVIQEIGLAITDTGTIFYVLRLNTNAVLCYIGQTSNGSAWGPEPTLISNAARGLDVAHPFTYDSFSDAVLLYVSYVSTTNVVSLSRLHQDWSFSSPVSVSNEPSADKTSVAARGRDVVIAWEYQGTTYQGVRSMHAEELSAANQDWELWPEWESVGGHYYDPLVAVIKSGSNRNAMVYESGTAVLFRENPYWSDNWGSATTVNEHAFTAGTGDKFAFEWMGDGFGLAYLGSGGGVYFYHQNLKNLIFADGFESGNVSDWSSSVP